MVAADLKSSLVGIVKPGSSIATTTPVVASSVPEARERFRALLLSNKYVLTEGKYQKPVNYGGQDYRFEVEIVDRLSEDNPKPGYHFTLDKMYGDQPVQIYNIPQEGFDPATLDQAEAFLNTIRRR